MIVTPNKIPVRHNGQLFGAGEQFEIDHAGYEKIQQHLDVVDDGDDKLNKSGANPEIEALRTRGKELGVKGYHNLGKEKLVAAIAEKQAELESETKLTELREQAASLGIEGADDMDTEKLTAEIAAKGGSGDAS